MEEEMLSIVRGTTNSFAITIKNANGGDHTLEQDQYLVFGLKRNEMDENRVLIKPITRTTSGEHYLELEPKETENLEPGIYYYDVGMQQGSSIFYKPIEATPIRIKPNVTKLGDIG